MRKYLNMLSLLAFLLAQNAYSKEEKLCSAMDTFVESVGPDKSKSIEFHTAWGHNFKGVAEEAIFAKRCIHQDDESAKNVCKYLMEHGAIEFSGTNFKNTLECLSPKTTIDALVQFEDASVSMTYGTDERGAIVDLSLKSNAEIDGMVLKIEVQGY